MFLFLVYEESRCSKFIHQIMSCLVGTLSSWNLRRKFSPALPSRYVFHMGDTEIHVALMYTAPWRNTLLTNCSWEQIAKMELITAAYCWQIINKLPHCSPYSIIPPSGPQVNYFPPFQMLSVIWLADSSVKLVCTSQQAAHRPPWRAEPWTRSTP
jgi:hypothetical protein